jgi:hypothetical protein
LNTESGCAVATSARSPVSAKYLDGGRFGVQFSSMGMTSTVVAPMSLKDFGILTYFVKVLIFSLAKLVEFFD